MNILITGSGGVIGTVLKNNLGHTIRSACSLWLMLKNPDISAFADKLDAIQGLPDCSINRITGEVLLPGALATATPAPVS